jgi:hypothetical protein
MPPDHGHTETQEQALDMSYLRKTDAILVPPALTQEEGQSFQDLVQGTVRQE